MVPGSMEPSGAFQCRGDLPPERLGLVGCAREVVPFCFGAPRDPPVRWLWSPPQAFSTPINVWPKKMEMCCGEIHRTWQKGVLSGNFMTIQAYLQEHLNSLASQHKELEKKPISSVSRRKEIIKIREEGMPGWLSGLSV